MLLGGLKAASAAQTFTSQDVLDVIQDSNLNSSSFPWSGDSDAGSTDGMLKRWDLSSLIPVKFDSASMMRQSTVNEALDLLESSIGMTLFDRSALNGVSEASVTRGLVVSYGTSYVPSGTSQQDLEDGFYQANVSGAPNTGGYPADFLQPDGTISARLYINLGNSVISDPDSLVIAHEFAHALGLGNHFAGFGMEDPLDENVDPEIDGLAFAVLSTMYRNDIGSTLGNINVYAAPEVGKTSLSFAALAMMLYRRRRKPLGA